MKTKRVKIISFMTALLLAMTMILMSPITGILAASETFTDDCADFTKVATKSTGLEFFADHAETHQSVIGKNVVTPQYLTYSATDKKITNFTLSIQIYKGFYVLTRDLEVSVRVYGSSTFQAVGTVAGAETAIAGISTYANIAVTPAATLPDNIQEIKITLLNDVLYIQMVNQVVLTYDTAAPVITPTGTPTATPTIAAPTATPTTVAPTLTPTTTPTTAAPTVTPTATPTGTMAETLFTDEFTTLDKMASKSTGWELFAEHAESGLSVIGKTNVSPQNITYERIGNTIKSIEISLQIYPGFFELMRDLDISVRLEGSEDFVSVPLVTGAQVAVQSPYATLAINTVNALPANVEEVKITLLNDVLWTVMLNQVKIVYLGEFVEPTAAPTSTAPTATPTDEQDNSAPVSPESGESSSGYPIVMLIFTIVVAAAVLLKTKNVKA